MMTSAPARAKARTICRPRPRLPPVTRATLPERSNSASLILVRPGFRLLGGLVLVRLANDVVEDVLGVVAVDRAAERGHALAGPGPVQHHGVPVRDAA